MDKSNSYLGTESVGKLLLKLSIPSVVAQIINMLYNVVDRIYIGHIPESGSLALTGLGVCAPVLFIISALAALFYFGSSANAASPMRTTVELSVTERRPAAPLVRFHKRRLLFRRKKLGKGRERHAQAVLPAGL